MPTAQRPSRFRLARDVRPSEYHLHLHPDLDTGTFRGDVRIAVTLDRSRREITLHATDLVMDAASVHVGSETIPAKAVLSKTDQTVTLKTARPVPAGEASLALQFHGTLSQHLRGFYAASAGGARYAFTQCETADARRVLPCFDEPAYKARFRVSVTAPRAHTVLSNAPVEREEALDAATRIVHFAPTPPLSTYLLALAVGPLEASEVRHLGATPIRVWHVPGKAHLAAFGLEAGVETLRRLEEYFGLPYPYDKLDLVAVPDFEAGAMENAGAVFFRETLLLLDPATSSMAERKRAAEVIAHELAHMWYGDLVTMAWWDDLWLNEAFATWMAYRVVDDWKPEWRMWQSFEHDRAGALGLDALSNTHPIYAEVRSVAEATENFDLITYEKGAAVVRMIEHYLGADAFRDGVRIYMRRHREGNAVAADLWRALEEASKQEVARVAQSWIAQSGFPLVSIKPAPGSGVALAVRQERFFADPKVSPAKRRQRWPVPMVLKLPDDRTTRVLVDKASQRVALKGRRPAWVFGNASAGGFYRVLHDTTTRAALLADLSVLTAVERLALVGDQWAMVRAARAPIESFLDVAAALAGELDHDVLDGVSGPLAAIDDQVVVPGSELQHVMRTWVARRFGPALTQLGWTPAADEPDAERLQRAALVRLVGGVAEAPEVLDEARARLDAYLSDRGTLEPNLADVVVGLAARAGDDALYERYRSVIAEARTPQEQRRFLLSLAAFRTPATIRRTLDALRNGEVPTQDMSFILMRLFANPAGGAAAWTFLTKRWSTLKKRIPPLMLARLVEATPALREPRYAREVRSFFTSHPVPEAARALRQAMERFRLNAELRKRTAPGLARWLEKSA
ncbi:MAG TPA: M1 family aminopeptidase [Candidatus Binatia bacterium]|jgi:puromycin-sensitive aminopeptidase|nr:M1 family aminopeptidase [Candidatus Binatia bacterium]